MMQCEFEKLTNLRVTGEEYDRIERLYMESPLSKQQFCREYRRPAPAVKAANQSFLKGYLRDWLENAANGIVDEDTTLDIAYTDGTTLRLGSDGIPAGTRVRRQGIKNIVYADGWIMCDYHYDNILSRELVTDGIALGFLPEHLFNADMNILVVDDMDDYWRRFEEQGYYAA